MSVRRKKQQRVVAVLLCLCLLAAFMFCGMMVAKHALHHCNDANCHICEVLQSAQNVAKQLIFAACAAIAAVFALPAVMPLYQRRDAVCAGNSRCLVDLKIRINH